MTLQSSCVSEMDKKLNRELMDRFMEWCGEISSYIECKLNRGDDCRFHNKVGVEQGVVP